MSGYRGYGYTEYFTGRMHQQQSDRRALRDSDDAIAEWMQYARQLEEKLAQRDAEVLAARTQRNVMEKYLADAGLGGAHAFARIREEVDTLLRQRGIYIQRNGTAQTVHRIQR